MSEYERLARLGCTVRPFSTWPEAETHERSTSPFSAPLSSTVGTLAAELAHLEAERVVLQLAIPESRIRLDGLPYADAKCDHPGVMLGFDSAHGPLRYACDRFVASPWKRSGGSDWTHNLRAIALGLEALRKVDRYGISKRGEQYRGYAELPAGIPLSGPTHLTTEQAARLIVETAIPIRWGRADVDEDGIERAAQAIRSDPHYRKDVYRDAVKAAHPDRHGGSTEAFQQLQAAKELLDREETDRG